MSRPRKIRILNTDPQHVYFKPAGIPMRTLQQIEIFHDEYEALKLANIDWMNMKEWAEKLWISAPTFNRILNSAYKKITNAIVNWKAINIQKE